MMKLNNEEHVKLKINEIYEHVDNIITTSESIVNNSKKQIEYILQLSKKITPSELDTFKDTHRRELNLLVMYMQRIKNQIKRIEKNYIKIIEVNDSHNKKEIINRLYQLIKEISNVMDQMISVIIDEENYLTYKDIIEDIYMLQSIILLEIAELIVIKERK